MFCNKFKTHFYLKFKTFSYSKFFEISALTGILQFLIIEKKQRKFGKSRIKKTWLRGSPDIFQVISKQELNFSPCLSSMKIENKFLVVRKSLNENWNNTSEKVFQTSFQGLKFYWIEYLKNKLIFFSKPLMN